MTSTEPLDLQVVTEIQFSTDGAVKECRSPLVTHGMIMCRANACTTQSRAPGCAITRGIG